MLQRLPVRWSAPTLLLGIVLGVAWDSIPWTRPAHAKSGDPAYLAEAAPAERSTSDRPASTLVEASRQLAQVAVAVTPSVVHIESKFLRNDQRLVEETGSGVIVNSAKVPGCFVITNRHVIGDAAELRQVSVKLSDGRSFHPSRKWVDRETDLAVLQIAAENTKPAAWGNSDLLEIGNLVLAVGSPFGLSQSVTMGIVSARGRALHLGRDPEHPDRPSDELVNQDFIQTDAAINFGNSGGPLIDVQGQVVGINTAIASNSGGNDGIGFSIPSNLVRRIVNDLLERGQVRRAYLGVALDPDFTIEKANDLKLDRVRGARVERVYPGSPGDRAGLQANDVVLTFDGVKVLDYYQLINLVSLTEVGHKVTLTVFRDGKRITIDVTLANRQELDGRSELPNRPGMGWQVEPLGLTLHEITGDLAAQLGFARSTRGLLVLRVDPRSSLSGHVEVYDILEEVARKPVASVDEVRQALAQTDAPGEVLLRFKSRTGTVQHSHIVVWRR